MAKPRIFVSSTYYDLRHIRSSLEQFIKGLGYDPILSEKGNIAYLPDVPLDDSCYREASMSEIFILIIGGRYGSPASSNNEPLTKNFYERYDSITRMEYESAVNRDIPTYILIEKSVYAEYETYKKNKNKKNIDYAHVDSINIFHLVEEILNQPRNNPVHQFDNHQDIEAWLKEQWAGLFRELISQRSEKAQLASLSRQVGELANINTTLKRYLEEVIVTTSEGEGEQIIREEDDRLKKSRIMAEIKNHPFYKNILDLSPITRVNQVIKFISKPTTFKELASDYANILNEEDNGDRLFNYWMSNKIVRNKWNGMRAILDLPPLK